MSARLGPDDNLAAVVRQLASDGYAVQVVAAGPDRRSTYAAIAAALGFPDWFGHNADALYDSLRDWAADGHRRALVLAGLSDLERADANGAALICAVLDDIEADNPHVLMVVVDR